MTLTSTTTIGSSGTRLVPPPGVPRITTPYAPGLHHFCFRVADEAAVDRAAEALRVAGVDATEPRYYPEYDPDYYATFFPDPDGLRLEISNFRERRRRLMYDWEAENDAQPPKGVR